EESAHYSGQRIFRTSYPFPHFLRRHRRDHQARHRYSQQSCKALISEIETYWDTDYTEEKEQNVRNWEDGKLRNATSQPHNLFYFFAILAFWFAVSGTADYFFNNSPISSSNSFSDTKPMCLLTTLPSLP
ncbi:MAG: hypothetical protein HW406_2489, partial [Candidatus Brocadiaceae bacterium]|nr:hypothetical protein [Candidatus Brocadiaceae bacterium]